MATPTSTSTPAQAELVKEYETLQRQTRPRGGLSLQALHPAPSPRHCRFIRAILYSSHSIDESPLAPTHPPQPLRGRTALAPTPLSNNGDNADPFGQVLGNVAREIDQ